MHIHTQTHTHKSTHTQANAHTHAHTWPSFPAPTEPKKRGTRGEDDWVPGEWFEGDEDTRVLIHRHDTPTHVRT